jgi:hypothetical protein
MADENVVDGIEGVVIMMQKGARAPAIEEASLSPSSITD